ncbi:cupin domain-containing protein [Streptomyces sp. NPDC094034]|uniref:JmjC domain-containing protein n=1 Tax=Streptomyces sp. NPDC094034 TaxID=3155309 RepID=UPI00331BB289
MSLSLLMPQGDVRPNEPLLVHRGRTAVHESFSMPLLDDYIETECLPAAHVLLLRDGRVLERDHYVREERLIAGKVRHFLDQGYTLSLRNLQDLLPFFNRMCRTIQRETGYPCHATGYLTPPGARGLGCHWDPYTVVVAQISGTKFWPLYRPVVHAPVREHLSFPRTTTSRALRERLAGQPPDHSIRLAPGDTLWVPRGWIHQPRTVGHAPSLHVTFALRELTRSWLAHQLVDHLVTEDFMREALHEADLTSDLVSEVVRTRELLCHALASLDLRKAEQEIRRSATKRPLTT